MQCLRKTHYYSKTHRNVKFKLTSWNSTRLILNRIHIFQQKEKIHLIINTRNFIEFCAINADNLMYNTITLAQTTHTKLHNSYSSSYYLIIYYRQNIIFFFFRNINTRTSCWYLLKKPLYRFQLVKLLVNIIWGRKYF